MPAPLTRGRAVVTPGARPCPEKPRLGLRRVDVARHSLQRGNRRAGMVLGTPGFLAVGSRSVADGVSALQISVRPRSRFPVAITTFCSGIR